MKLTICKMILYDANRNWKLPEKSESQGSSKAYKFIFCCDSGNFIVQKKKGMRDTENFS